MSFIKQFFTGKKTEYKEILDILKPQSRIFCTKQGKKIFEKHPNFYEQIRKRFSKSSVEDRFETNLKMKTKLFKMISKSWNSSNTTAIWQTVKNDMQTSKETLGYFIAEWCQELKLVFDKYLQDYSSRMKDFLKEKQNYKIDFDQFDKQIMKLFHKNILILMQLLWEVLSIVYQYFFNENQRHFIIINQVSEEQLKKRRQDIRIAYERLMLAHLTSLKPFKDFVSKIIPPRVAQKKGQFQEFLKAKFNITEKYSQVFFETFRTIEEYHYSPCLKEKFSRICTFYSSIDSSIKESQKRTLSSDQIIKSENSVPQLFTYIFKIIYPQTCISAMYIDIFFSLKSEDISWDENYKDMEKQLEIFFKQNFIDDLTNHYERLRKAYNSQL